MPLVELLNKHAYHYFHTDFASEKFDLVKANINASQISYVFKFQTLDRFNLPFLLLDRATQSLGLQTCSYLLAEQGQLFRFLFLKRINWEFHRPIRPNRLVFLDANYNCNINNDRKLSFDFTGSINGNCANFLIDIDVFLK